MILGCIQDRNAIEQEPGNLTRSAASGAGGWGASGSADWLFNDHEKLMYSLEVEWKWSESVHKKPPSSEIIFYFTTG